MVAQQKRLLSSEVSEKGASLLTFPNERRQYEVPRLFTGLQPSGRLHIGNYFGALKPFVESYEQYESFLMVADYHALTTVREGEKLSQGINDVVRDYLAIGIDPTKAVIFKQSDVPQHTELAWIFECLVTVPFLMQAHAYKDKVAKGIEPNAGLFNYPMLMAADILLYDTAVVPVGEDQRQHVEYAREAAGKFNRAYGETFAEPKELILPSVGIVPGTDGAKMSKSYGNIIPLFGTKEETQKAVMSIVTDSGETREEAAAVSKDIGETVMRRGISFATNLFAIHKLFRSEEELVPLYEQNKGSYKTLKEALADDIDRTLAPMRERRANITDEDVRNVLKDGAEKARTLAEKKMEDIRKKVGVTF